MTRDEKRKELLKLCWRQLELGTEIIEPGVNPFYAIALLAQVHAIEHQKRLIAAIPNKQS